MAYTTPSVIELAGMDDRRNPLVGSMLAFAETLASGDPPPEPPGELEPGTGTGTDTEPQGSAATRD